MNINSEKVFLKTHAYICLPRYNMYFCISDPLAIVSVYLVTFIVWILSKWIPNSLSNHNWVLAELVVVFFPLSISWQKFSLASFVF